jgi:hypothetical protein
MVDHLHREEKMTLSERRSYAHSQQALKIRSRDLLSGSPGFFAPMDRTDDSSQTGFLWCGLWL